MQTAYAGQANILTSILLDQSSSPVVPITGGTANFYLIAWTGDNAGKWWRGSDSTWQAAESVAGSGTHKARGIWSCSIPADAWEEGDQYQLYAVDSGDLMIPVPEDVQCVTPGAEAGSSSGSYGTGVLAGLTFIELQTEVRDLLNRGSDSNLITQTRVKRWINEGLAWIGRQFPTLRDLRVLDKTTWKPVAGQYEYQLSDFSSVPVGRPLGLWYVEKARKIYRRLEPPVGGKFNWDREIFDRQQGTDRGTPTYYLQRGTAVEIDLCPDSNEVYLTVTGCTSTDADDPTVITNVGAFADYELDGKDIFVSGTNITTGWYSVDTATDDAITLTEKCTDGGGAGAAVKIHIGGVFFLEYGRIPPKLTENSDTAILTYFDMPLIYAAQAKALQSPILKRTAEGLGLEKLARELILERIEQERPLELATRNPYQGP